MNVRPLSCPSRILVGSLLVSSLLAQGPFSPAATLAPGLSGRTALAAGDFDGDGDLDLVVAGRDGGGTGWLENVGDGAFGPRQLLPAAGAPPSVSDAAPADVDGDGWLDLVVVSSGAFWFRNEGDGTFAAAAHLVTVIGSEWIEAGDLDDDGDVDFYLTGGSGGVALFNDGAGGIGQQLQLGFSSHARCQLVDLGGDGDLDIVVALSGSSAPSRPVVAYENLGGGSFANQTTLVSAGIGPFDGAWDVAVADLDGDGDDDILSAYPGVSVLGGQGVIWNEYLGNGTYGPQQHFDGLAAYSVAAGDFDGDGDADVVACSVSDDRVILIENLGGGSFAPRLELATGVAAWDLVVADIDGGGPPDLVVGSEATASEPSIRYWRNESDFARNDAFGFGCAGTPRSLYQFLPDASTAPAVLDGRSLVFTPSVAGNGYVASWGGNAFLPPAPGAQPLALTDDGEVSVALANPFPTSEGMVEQLWVAANGVVSLGSNVVPSTAAGSFVPAPDAMLHAAVTAWYSWHDYNPTEVGSGPVTFSEQIVGADPVALVTWDGVESFPKLVGNPSTLQFQFRPATGQVTIAWQQISGNAQSLAGSAHLIGYSRAGSQLDPGDRDLAGELPLLVGDDVAPTLLVGPEPVSTPVSGTTLIYTAAGLPQSAAGMHAAFLMFSTMPAPAGLPLDGLGAPGCTSWIQTLGQAQLLFDLGDTAHAALQIPAGVASGFELTAMVAALTPPGVNALRLVTSNAVSSRVGAF